MREIKIMKRRVTSEELEKQAIQLCFNRVVSALNNGTIAINDLNASDVDEFIYHVDEEL